MKVALVHSYYSDDAPSGENAVVDMQIAALREAGHDARLFSVRTDELRGQTLYSVRTAVNVALGWGIDLSQDLFTFAPDVVHVHNLFPNLGTDWLRRWDGPVVSTVHNFRPMCASGNLFRAGETCTLCPDHGQQHAVVHRCYKGSALATLPLAIRNRRGLSSDAVLARADQVIFLSERSKQRYVEFGFPTGKASVVPNFVDNSPSVQIPSEDRRWVYAGRLSADKGILSLLEYWPEDQMLDVYGDGPEMTSLRNKSFPSVTLHGSVSRREVLNAVGGAEGVVIPSLWAEGLPTIYLEALAAGVPVLAKSGNSAADDVESSGCGVVFTEMSAVQPAIKAISANRESLSQIASTRFVNMFTRQAWVQRVEAIYESLVSSS
jgi:glycosyltransferase involved in cell wall biosynthesis